jgi:hypothetical protein
MVSNPNARFAVLRMLSRLLEVNNHDPFLAHALSVNGGGCHDFCGMPKVSRLRKSRKTRW